MLIIFNNSNGTLAQGWGSGSSYFPYLVDPLAGLSDALGKKVEIASYLDDWNLEEAADTAKDADYAFVFSNSDSGEEYITVDGNKGDRNNLSLWHNGDNLVSFILLGLFFFFFSNMYHFRSKLLLMPTTILSSLFML